MFQLLALAAVADDHAGLWRFYSISACSRRSCSHSGEMLLHGWQSTLRTSPAAVYKLVSWIAAPWSFLPNAHPTSEEVLQSRFSYSEGMTALASPATTSWWPFLFYATFFYGLLVRVVLLDLVRCRSAPRTRPLFV